MPKQKKKSAATKAREAKFYRNKRKENQNNKHNPGASNANQINNEYIKYNYSPNVIKAAKNFDDSCSSLSFNSCNNCNTRFINDKIKNNSCTKCLKNSIKFTKNNNMDPGEIPEPLKNLTYIEQMLIAQVHPVMSIFRIRGAQYWYSGNIINFRQNIEDYITKLPLNPSKLPSTLIFNRNTPAGLAHFKVRANVIRNALIWLKQFNIYYKNIEIDDEVINQLPIDGDVMHLLHSLDLELTDNVDDNLTESYVPLLTSNNEENIVDDAYVIFLDAILKN